MDGAQATAKVKTSVDAGVGIITLSDPGTLNAAGLDLMGELTAAFEDFAYGDKVRSIVITGESSFRRSAMPDEMVIAPRSSLVERRFRIRELISSRAPSMACRATSLVSPGKITANSSPP